VEDATCEHNVGYKVHVPMPTRVLDDGKSCLKDPETPFYIFPDSFLARRKIGPFFVWW
jgi:hypothetical protein